MPKKKADDAPIDRTESNAKIVVTAARDRNPTFNSIISMIQFNSVVNAVQSNPLSTCAVFVFPNFTVSFGK